MFIPIGGFMIKLINTKKGFTVTTIFIFSTILLLNFLISGIYLFSGLCTLYALIVSPAGLNWSRSYFGGILFVIIALLSSVPSISEKSEVSANLSQAALAIFWMYALVTFTLQFPIAVVDICKSYLQISEQYNYINAQKKKGNLHPVVREFNFTPETNYPAYSPRLSHLTDDIHSKYNVPMADYFNVETIQSVPENVWSKKYRLE